MTKGNCYPSSCAGGVSDPNRWQVNRPTTITYDPLGRLKGKTFATATDPLNYPVPNDPGSYAVSYAYDVGTNGKGHRTSMADASGTTTWQYDVYAG